jgi:hypothetical protein
MPREIEGWPSPYPVSFWFSLGQRVQKVGIILEIGPLIGTERRRRLVQAFRQSGFTVSNDANREKAKYSRIYSDAQVVRDLGDPEEVKQALEKLWRQSRSELERAQNVIMNFDW